MSIRIFWETPTCRIEFLLIDGNLPENPSVESFLIYETQWVADPQFQALLNADHHFVEDLQSSLNARAFWVGPNVQEIVSSLPLENQFRLLCGNAE